MLSSKLTSESHGQDSSYFLGWQEYQKNPYHHLHNPNGIIQMGVAENQLSLDMLEAWLEDNHEALGMKRNGESIFKQLALFQDYHGLPHLKNEMVKFMSKIRGNKVEFDPNNLVITAGSTSANESIVFCIAGDGDAFLLPTPYYPGFDRDLKWRTGVEIVPIRTWSSNGFRITPPALEEAHKRATKQGLRVKGVLITNPSNPLGTTMLRDELHHLVDFALENSLHVVSDEVYSGTVFDPPDFVSISEVISDRNLKDAQKMRGLVHVVYSVSKDFGLPGFRVGLVYSENRVVVAGATRMASFGLASAQTQHLVACVLGDEAFAGRFVAESRRRVGERRAGLVSGLREAGVGCLEGNAGLFCWVDMRKFLWADTFEAERELWEEMVRGVRVNVTPGGSCHCSEPGWFRVCFANVPEEEMRVGVERVRMFVESRRSVRLLPLAKWVLKLCPSGRELESDR